MVLGPHRLLLASICFCFPVLVFIKNFNILYICNRFSRNQQQHAFSQYIFLRVTAFSWCLVKSCALHLLELWLNLFDYTKIAR